jgi:adenosylhomocysteine nucleosidase
MTKLVIECGMPSEKAVLTQALGPDILIIQGQRQNLAEYVPSDTTHIISMGLAGGLVSQIKVADIVVASSLVDANNRVYTPDMNWSERLFSALQNYTAPNQSGEQSGTQHDLNVPAWVSRVSMVPWYSSGIMDQADTMQQRTTLHDQTAAWVIDDESFFVAQLARARKIPWAIVRSISDDASDTLPLAMRGQIMNANGSPNIAYFFQEIAQEPLSQTLDIPALVLDFNESLATLAQAAVCCIQGMLS